MAVAMGCLAGLVIADLARQLTPRRTGRRSMPSLSPRQRRGALIAAVAVASLAAPPIALLATLAWWTRGRVRAHRAEQAVIRRVTRALPDLVDLLALACSAGLSLPVAHPLVAAHTPHPVGPALLTAHHAAAAGQPRADAIVTALAPLGDRARALADVLVDHLRYGVPLLPALERTGLELRIDRRREAELAARRVPIRLLAPLVSCVLPAFALLTVVPLLAASLDALPS